MLIHYAYRAYGIEYTYIYNEIKYYRKYSF